MRRAYFLPLLLWCGTAAQADLLTSLTVVQTAEAGGLFRYAYTLTVDQSSDVSAGVFALEIPSEADLSSISGPTGWDIDYIPGLTAATWISSAPTFDLSPGSSALFGFLSPLDVNQREYLVAGFGDTDIFTSTGQIAGPGVTVVPEPSTLSLMGFGITGLICYSHHRRGTARKSPILP